MRKILAAMSGVILLAGCDRVTVTEEEVRPPESKVVPAQSPEKPPAAGEVAGGGEIRLEKATLTAPKTWLRQQPRFGFILAEFTLPRAQGDSADGRLTLSVAGGTLADNLARWRKQFVGKPQKDSEEKLEVSGVKVTLVDLSGTYNDQRGMMGPSTERPDYRLLGAVFEAGGQLHFIKAYGPAMTMAARADEFRTLVRSLKVLAQ